MAVGPIRVTLTAQLPWWWRAYVWALYVKALAGLEVDCDAAGKVVARHTRFSVR